MDENDLVNVIAVLHDINSDSSSDSSSNSSSTSSSSSEDDENHNALEDDIYEDDLLFPVLQILMNDHRRHRVDNFIQVVHLKSDEEFRQDFRLSNRVQIDR